MTTKLLPCACFVLQSRYYNKFVSFLGEIVYNEYKNKILLLTPPGTTRCVRRLGGVRVQHQIKNIEVLFLCAKKAILLLIYKKMK